MVMVIKKEGDWWTGTIGNRTGMFPSNYVQKADVGGTAASNTETDMNSTYDDTYKVSILSIKTEKNRKKNVSNSCIN